MDFINKALFSEKDGTFIGAILTRFDPKDYLSRATVFSLSSEEMLKPDMIEPRGFMLDDAGRILSDANVRGDLSEFMASYDVIKFDSVSKTLDITDLMLLAADSGAVVLPNYADGKDTSIAIQADSFKVSDSSFNTYAGYKNADGEFRNCSLLNSLDGSIRDFYIAFHTDVDVSAFSAMLELVGATRIKDDDFNIYKAHAGLECFYSPVGESFLNFLAYQVAYYNIGEKILKQLLAMTRLASDETYKKSTQPRKERVEPRNVMIKHEYSKPYLKEIVDLLDDQEKLHAFLMSNPEAIITYNWYVAVMTSPWFTELEGKANSAERVFASATNLLPDCRKMRLKFALELLTHRYFIYAHGLINDKLGSYLTGGGVNGTSNKQFVV